MIYHCFNGKNNISYIVYELNSDFLTLRLGASLIGDIQSVDQNLSIRVKLYWEFLFVMFGSIEVYYLVMK